MIFDMGKSDIDLSLWQLTNRLNYQNKISTEMDNLHALALGPKLHNVLLKMSGLSRDLRDMCNLNSAIYIFAFKLLQTVTELQQNSQI